VAALNTLGKYLGMLTEKHEVKFDFTKLTDDQLADIERQLAQEEC
jgi:hypothetical protein